MQRTVFLGNEIREDASQERTHLNPGQEKTPRSYVTCQGGQLTRLNPISGEDSRYSYVRRGHTSILVKRG